MQLEVHEPPGCLAIALLVAPCDWVDMNSAVLAVARDRRNCSLIQRVRLREPPPALSIQFKQE